MTEKEIKKEGIYMGEIEKVDPLYHVYAGTENVYVIDDTMYTIHRFENKFTYMGKNNIEEGGIDDFIDLWSNQLVSLPRDLQKVINNLKEYQKNKKQ